MMFTRSQDDDAPEPGERAFTNRACAADAPLMPPLYFADADARDILRPAATSSNHVPFALLLSFAGNACSVGQEMVRRCGKGSQVRE